MLIPSNITNLVSVCEYESLRFAIETMLAVKQDTPDKLDIPVLSKHIDQLFVVLILVQYVISQNLQSENISEAGDTELQT